MLLADMTVPLWGGAELILHGGFDKESGRGVEKTYLTMGCEGFRELNIVADLVFSENFIRKVDAGDKPLTGKAGRVSCAVQTTVKNWNDMLLAIDMPRFAINGLDDFVFGVKQAVFDFSDSQNHPSTRFPNNYENSYLIPGQHETWKGVFAGQIEVVLPQQFCERNSGNRISFAATNMLIDNNGVSGLFSASNILPVERGSAGGWRFSVDKFAMTLEASTLTGAGFSGLIGLPVSDTANLAYEAIITPGNEYMLSVTPSKSFAFDFWKATVEIQKNSYVELKVIDGKFRPEATLHGSMSIRAGKDANSTKALAELKGVKFTGLHLQTVSPYFSVQSLGYSGELKLGSFPLSVSDIELKASGGEAKLGFNAKLMLAGDKTPINADTRLEIVGAMADNQWKYKGVNVSEIALNAKIASAFELAGKLQIMNGDKTYGDGFAGEIKLHVTKGVDLELSTRVIFGNVDFRYWLVDGSIKLPVGIPIGSALVLNGFGGGAYNRMRPEGKSALPTGVKYVPDEKCGMGFKASVMFRSAGSESLLQGSALFEIAFNKSGGVNFIGFYGEAKLLGEIPGIGKMEQFVNNKFTSSMGKEASYLKNKTPSELEKLKNNKPNEAAAAVYEQTEQPGTSGLLAVAGIKFDFVNNSFHANFDLYINAASGIIRGSGNNNKAGSVVLHIEQSKWYLHVGTPTNRVGLDFDLLIAKVKTGAYFMVGHDIPGSPSPPKPVADILGLELSRLDYMRNMNELGNGKGLAFGANLSVSTGDLTFLILYANFKAGLGFDIMLRNYDRPCVETGKVPGMDGWYANGQAYAYLQGELGVKVNLRFIKKKIPIIRGAAAALVQAKLPNPSWFAGYLGVKFNLLGGLVKGNMQFKFEIGKECTLLPADGAPLDIGEIISEMTPADQSTDVDVFAAPQVAFNMPEGKTFDINDDLGTLRKYRLKLVSYTVLDDKNVPVNGKNTWNSEKDRLSFTSHDILPAQTKMKAKVTVAFEEFANNEWKTVTQDGTTAEESMETAFTTGPAPTFIPYDNIQYCYPVLSQQYYYTGETNEAYVQLKRGQQELFTPDMRHEVRFTKGSTKKTVTPVYDANKKCLKYTMPELDKKSKYKMEVISYTATTTTAATAVEDRRNTVLSDEENEVSLRDAQALDAVRDDDEGITRLAYEFSSSSYAKFSDKLQPVRNDTIYYLWRDYAENMYLYLGSKGVGESFGEDEVYGSIYSEGRPLIESKATLSDSYYTNRIKSLVYNNFTKFGYNPTHRTVSVLGFPPAKAFNVLADYKSKKWFPYAYYLEREYRNDFYNLRLQIANNFENNGLNNYPEIMTTSFPRLWEGYYEADVFYVFPNGSKGSSNKLIFKNYFK
jgi:hypothetical protein